VVANVLPSPSSLKSLLVAGAFTLAAAFSAAQPVPASSDSAASAAAKPPEPTSALESAVAPADAVDIALVLPLDSVQYSRAADAVRAGFLAAAAASASTSRPRIKVFAHGDDEVLTAIEAARSAGAKIIVGPLVRDDVRTVASLALELPTTLALNQLDDFTNAPPALYTLSLGVEGDARLIARRMRNDQVQSIAVVHADTPLMKRFAGAFTAEWSQVGGVTPDVYGFAATPEALVAMRRELTKKPPDAALLALDGSSATQAKPYLGITRSYASGLVFDRETLAVIRDLDGLVIVEIPWLVTPQAVQFANLPRKEYSSDALIRLYALGLDAFRAAQSLRGGTPEKISFDGATGLLTLSEGRAFQREGLFAVFRSGQLTPLDGAR